MLETYTRTDDQWLPNAKGVFWESLRQAVREQLQRNARVRRVVSIELLVAV